MSVKRSIGKNLYGAISILLFILVIYLCFEIISLFDESNIECIDENEIDIIEMYANF